MRQELTASPIWTRKRRFLKSKSTVCVNQDGKHFDTLLSNPVCQMVSYAAVRSRNAARVFLFCPWLRPHKPSPSPRLGGACPSRCRLVMWLSTARTIRSMRYTAVRYRLYRTMYVYICSSCSSDSEKHNFYTTKFKAYVS